MKNDTPNDLYASDKEESDSVGLTIRLPRPLRDQFAALCASRDIEMSKVLRRFIEREVATHKS